MTRITAESLLAEYKASRFPLYWKHEVCRTTAKRIAGTIPRMGYERQIATFSGTDNRGWTITYKLWLSNTSNAQFTFVMYCH